MRIQSVDAVPFRNADYRCALVRLRTTGGDEGWGETESPAPEAVCAFIQHLLRHAIEGREMEPEPAAIGRVWHESAQDLKSANQAGGLALDALAAIDIALWDLAGKVRSLPVCALLAPEPRRRIGALWCGEPAQGHEFRHRKIYYSGSEHDVLVEFDQLRLKYGDAIAVAVDARWRLDWTSGPAFGAQLDQRQALWLECPIAADNPAWHGMLARKIHTPIAIGQAYRSLAELEPFFAQGGLRVLQPDPGRMGLSEAMRASHIAASYCMSVSPRAGRSAGPKIAAAVHLAAAAPECTLLAYHPGREYPCELREASWVVPDGPGLGIASPVLP